MNAENIDELIALKLTGTIDEEGEKALSIWINESEANAKHFEEMKKIWDAGNLDDQFNPDVEAAWENVEEELGLNETGKIIPMRKSSNTIYYRIAAAIVVLLGVTWIYTNQLSTPDMVRVASLSDQTEVILPDKSKVYLNANTSIEYPEFFKGKTREIKLEGEAFFEITKDKAHPFIIHTSNAYTKVLGTSFNILARKNAKDIVVSVKTGKVEVGIDNQQNVKLEPGYTAKVNLAAKSVEKMVTPSENYLSWKTKEMIFEDVEISELISVLSSYYNVEITANPEILDCHFTGKFNQPNITDVLNVLELSNGFTYEMKGDKISIKGVACN